MTPEYIVLLSLLLLYAGVLLWLASGFMRMQHFQVSEEGKMLPLSIIICARNEEKTIARCLKTIVQQNYDLDKIQILVVNDASTDNTVRQAELVLKNSGMHYRIISNRERKGKKQSITFAMQHAIHDVIVLRDADTFTLSYNWLKCISDFKLQKNSDLIIGPVAIADNSGSLWALQAIENNVLCVLNAGSAFHKKPFLASGANLIFSRQIFEKAGGYKSHLSIPSGDDVLFLEDVKKIPGAHIDFLKSEDALVYTYPSFSFSSLIKQKIRWAAKFSVNKNKLNFFLSLLIFLINAATLFSLFYGLLLPQNATEALLFVVFKLFIDFLLLFLAAGFIKNRSLAWYVLPIAFIYPVYACIVALASLVSKPSWK